MDQGQSTWPAGKFKSLANNIKSQEPITCIISKKDSFLVSISIYRLPKDLDNTTVFQIVHPHRACCSYIPPSSKFEDLTLSQEAPIRSAHSAAAKKANDPWVRRFGGLDGTTVAANEEDTTTTCTPSGRGFLRAPLLRLL